MIRAGASNETNRMTISQQTVSREVVVGIPQGLHARPADLLAREAQRWQSRIEVVGSAQRVDGKSILDLLTLAAEAGTRLVVEATGPDADWIGVHAGLGEVTYTGGGCDDSSESGCGESGYDVG